MMIRNDWYVIMGIFFLLFAYMFSRVIIYKTSDLCGTTQEVSSIIEINPLARLSYTLGGMAEFITYIILPTFILSIYVMVRRGKIVVEPIMLDIITTMFLLVAFMDAFNDFSVFFGVLSR